MIDLETRYKAVVHYKHFNPSLRKVSAIYNMSKSSLHRWIGKDPTVRKRRTTKQLSTSIVSAIRECLANNPFITSRGVAEVVSSSCGIKRSRSCMSSYIKQCRFSRKKAYRMVDHQHSAEGILRFCNEYLEAPNIVCIDEVGFYVGDHGKYGYSQIGKRLRVTAGKTLRRSKFSVIMAMSHNRVVGYDVLDHNCRKPDFVKFVRNLNLSAGSTLLMDNIKFHHSVDAANAFTQKGYRVIFTPPYSPRGNAIENLFGALKTEYRSQCPPRPDANFDYESLLISLFECWSSSDLLHGQSYTMGLGNKEYARR